MKSVTKAAFAASATVIFMGLGLFGEEAEAEPVVSSWYGSELEGAPTASGEPYRPNEYTAAHPSLP
ncbi:MAG: septal ring lytic transglycosylase RlpA family protein, partial [Actinomycetota bacterium]|nr:septal ring lytic transglycosylase RlpA family protein [Actinomycetota bacterium]